MESREADDLREVASMLRAVVRAVSATTAPERRTARRIEGAAVGLESAISCPDPGVS